MSDRRQESYAVRLEAAELARSRIHPTHKANGDEQKYAGAKYFMSFTKGLPHEEKTGLLHDPQDFVEFRRAVDEGFIDPFSERVRHGGKYKVTDGRETQEESNDFRQWEAPTAGVVYELEGPDAQAVTMPPAPPLITKDGGINSELVLEMAEVYELAVLRDMPLNAFEGKTDRADNELKSSINRLNALDYIKNKNVTGRPRKVNSKRKLDPQTVFRGSSPGVEIGPYLSQFMLLGNRDLNMGGSVTEGLITYGVLQIDQKVPVAKPNTDYMTKLEEYVRVQRGLRPTTDPEIYVDKDGNDAESPARPARRFISTPRDLATYVHYDALYEAYLNACIILLGMKTPFDPAFDHLSGGGVASDRVTSRRRAGGFALYGGPHILNLVTEVATRALKAVRFQKFNNHMRLRPEAFAARIELLREPAGKDIPALLCQDIGLLKKALSDNEAGNPSQSTLDAIARLTGKNNSTDDGTTPGESNYFLPMAFPEGSPMHPAYGAGHATVAGACVTILKAFFDTSAVLVGNVDTPENARFKRCETDDRPIALRAPELNGQIVPDEEKLKPYVPSQFLTLEGELNKLAANISIGRNMAGVHFFSDYYDSVRMGEEIAIGILEEQALTYSTDPFVLSLPTFDGDVVRIGRR